MKYSVRFVHKIRPNPGDVMEDVGVACKNATSRAKSRTGWGTDMNRDTMNKAICNHFRAQASARIKSLAAQANFELCFGPAHGFSGGWEPGNVPWPGFEKATTELAEWCSENVCDVWYDSNTDHVSESEPESSERCYDCGGSGQHAMSDAGDYEDCTTCVGSGHVEIDCSEVCHVPRRDVMRAVFGAELANYL